MIKQILSILLILCCYFGIKAQPSFELYYSESKLNNGDTLKIQTQPNLIDQQYIKVKNTSCCSKNVLVRKNELSLAQNTEITFCWAECYPAETMLSPEPILIEASTVCESFSTDFDASSEGTSYVLYTFFDETNSNDSVSVYFQYNCGKASIANIINEVKLSAYPNPAKNNITIDYFINNANNTFLRVYNIAGEIMYEKALQSGSNKINIDLSNWNTGIYMYSIHRNKHTYISKKLIITK